jgi:hypothetical protein
MGQQGIVHAEHAHDQEGISMHVLMWVWILIQIGIVIQSLLVIGYLLARLVVGERWDIVVSIPLGVDRTSDAGHCRVPRSLRRIILARRVDGPASRRAGANSGHL